MKFKMIRSIMMLIIMLVSTNASAQSYEWTDQLRRWRDLDILEQHKLQTAEARAKAMNEAIRKQRQPLIDRENKQRQAIFDRVVGKRDDSTQAIVDKAKKGESLTLEEQKIADIELAKEAKAAALIQARIDKQAEQRARGKTAREKAKRKN